MPLRQRPTVDIRSSGIVVVTGAEVGVEGWEDGTDVEATSCAAGEADGTGSGKTGGGDSTGTVVGA